LLVASRLRLRLFVDQCAVSLTPDRRETNSIRFSSLLVMKLSAGSHVFHGAGRKISAVRVGIGHPLYPPAIRTVPSRNRVAE
jgi:hypothetical protein